MIKHTQTIRRQKPTSCLIVYDHFVRLALWSIKELTLIDQSHPAFDKRKKDGENRQNVMFCRHSCKPAVSL